MSIDPESPRWSTEDAYFAFILGHLPKPLDLRTADPNEPEADASVPGGIVYTASIEYAPRCWTDYEVTPELHRIASEYADARERREEAEEMAAAARWAKPPPVPEPEPEEIPPAGKLTPRQEEFCRRYAAQPVATRAAALAGYAEESAHVQGSRLLKNPLVLDRIAQIRAERNIRYVLERDTLHDKLEAVFFEALAERNLPAAVAALRLQASIGGMIFRPAAAENPAPPARTRSRRRRKDKVSPPQRRRKIRHAKR